MSPEPVGTLLYVGTYGKSAPGIHLLRFDPTSGAVSPAGVAAEVASPFFVTLDSKRRFLFAASICEECDGVKGGAVCAYAVDAASGALTFLNRQPSHGTVPCYLSVTGDARHLLVANYGSGSLAVFPVEKDGRLRPATCTVQHEGSSVSPSRQEGPHIHAVVLSPDDRYVFAPDLGIDKVMAYRLDGGRLISADPPFARTRAGAGPRHFAFHPDGRRAYLINELDSTVTSFDYEPAGGALSERQTFSTLPDGHVTENYCADIKVHPSGRFLYGSNRGHDSAAVFAIGPATGRLVPVGRTATGGAWPWNLAIDPTGAFLLAANQRGNSVTSLRIDAATGRLAATGHSVSIPAPVCLTFV